MTNKWWLTTGNKVMTSGVHRWTLDIVYEKGDKSGIIWGITRAGNKEIFRAPTLNLLNKFVIGSGGS